MKVLVTGGAGFIGHHLARTLVERGHDVVILDDLSTGLASRLDGLGRAQVIVGDIRDPDATRQAMEGCEVVFHQAALPSVARSVEDPLRSTSVNVDGTVQVMLSAAASGVRRVVYAGSSSIYGSGPELPRRETQRPEPRSPYAASKLAAEHLVHAIGAIHGIDTVVLRYFNVFGPGQDPDSQYAAVIPRFVTAALDGRPPEVRGDGHQSRDFTYIDNVIEANFAASTPPTPTGLTCNIGCGSRYSLLELLREIEAALGMKLKPRFVAPQVGDVPHSLADISLARAALGYTAPVSFGEGVRRTVEWYVAQRERASAEGAGQIAP